MKKHAFSVAVMAIVMMLVLSSCEKVSFIRTVDSLLTPPLYYSEYEGLVEAFNESVGKNVVLCSPDEGDYLSAITVNDLDGDGNEDAVIFYRDAQDENKAHISVFRCFDDKWSSSVGFTGYGNEVASLTIDDLDGDGISELIVIWDYSGTNSGGVISVYNSTETGGKFKEAGKESCDIAGTVDMDDDGKSEIVYISSSNDGTIVTKTAYLKKMENGAFTTMGTASVDPNVGGYASFKTEKYSEHYPMKVYVDGIKSGNIMITEVLYWDQETQSLVAPLFNEETNSNTLTVRYESIQCADINDDGQIEIPVQTARDNSEVSVGAPAYITDWVLFEGNVPMLTTKTYVNVNDGYIINLGDLNNNALNIRAQDGTNWTSWVVYAESGTVGGDALFTVIKLSREDFKDNSGYITIMSTADDVICVNINSAGLEQGIDENQIRQIVVKLP